VKNLFSNTLFSAMVRLSAYVYSLALAPLLLGRLGLAAFGVWAVTGALAHYAGLLDLGLSRSLSRFVALYDAQRDRRAIAECVGLGLCVGGTVGALALGVAALSAPLATDVLGVLTVGDMRIVLLSAATILACTLVGSAFSAVPAGLRRNKRLAAVGVSANTLNFVASVVCLALTTDLVTYAIVNAAVSVTGMLAVVWVFTREWSAPWIARPTGARFREVTAFSLKGQVSWLAQLVNQQTDKIIIAVILGPRAAGAFEIANRIVLAVQSIGTMTLTAMIPAATAALVEEGRGALRGFYRHYTQRSVALAFPIFGVACVSAPYLLVAWLGSSPGEAELIVVALSCAFAVNIVTGVGMTLTMSDGRPGLVAKTAVFTAVLNVVATVALAPLFGLWGILAGTMLAEVLGSLVQVAVFHRTYKVPARDLAVAALPPALLAVGLALPFVAWYAIAGTAVADRATAAAGLAVTAGSYAIVYWLVASRRGWLPEPLTPGALWRRVAGVRASRAVA